MGEGRCHPSATGGYAVARNPFELPDEPLEVFDEPPLELSHWERFFLRRIAAEARELAEKTTEEDLARHIEEKVRRTREDLRARGVREEMRGSRSVGAFLMRFFLDEETSVEDASEVLRIMWLADDDLWKEPLEVL
jgi:hypothetical protein